LTGFILTSCPLLERHFLRDNRKEFILTHFSTFLQVTTTLANLIFPERVSKIISNFYISSENLKKRWIKMKFVIDAGHGYSTPGKRSPSGMKEYEFNRAAAQSLKEALLGYENTEVFFTHSDQEDVSLKRRTDFANTMKADVFISIHANAFGTGWNDARGIETYVYKTKPAAAVRLAGAIQNRLVFMTGLVNRGVKAADFHVLRETKMTAVLVECGFMTNRKEAEMLSSPNYRIICGHAIASALADFYNLKKKTKKRSLYKVQAGAFSKKENAEALALLLKKAGFDAFVSRD
jgi:N-acetylmuramoyl-L-alanine amidase